MRVDTRAGSKDYIEKLQAAGVKVEPTILISGDVEIVGNGPGGVPVLVGVELKKLPDLWACIRNGRFAEQLRAMKANYQVSWLVIEGRMRGCDGKTLYYHTGEKWREADARMTYAEMAGWTMTMAAAAGVLTWKTEDEFETVAWLKQLDKWWTDKVWESHRAHLEIYTPPAQDSVFVEPTLCHRVARVLPWLGAKRAAAAAGTFGSTWRMMDASEAEWAAVDGVGKLTAKRLVEAVRSDR